MWTTAHFLRYANLIVYPSVNIAAEWTNNNDMKINSEKSKEMIISYAHGNIGNEVPNNTNRR